jgi:hypothetical protein
MVAHGAVFLSDERSTQHMKLQFVVLTCCFLGLEKGCGTQRGPKSARMGLSQASEAISKGRGVSSHAKQTAHWLRSTL